MLWQLVQVKWKNKILLKLQSVLGIGRDELITNNVVLTRTGPLSVEVIIAKSQLRFLGHLSLRQAPLPPLPQ